MIIIADSGSTKTHWRLLTSDVCKDFFTKGINPYQESFESMSSTIESFKKETGNTLEIKNIYFYGAGCGSDINRESLKKLLFQVFNCTTEVYSDILGAARGLCGNEKGIVGILGTGANICYYNGREIFQSTNSLGFILGDEGSGAYIGKNFIQDVLNKEAPDLVIDKFNSHFTLSKEDILNAVYKHPYPNRFLASFTRFLASVKEIPYVEQLLNECFRAFFTKHVCKYENFQKLKFNCVGSVAFYFMDQIKNVAAEFNMELGIIRQNPMEGLTAFHIGNQ